MPSDFVALITIHDREGHDRYLVGFGDVFDRYRGRVFAVNDHAVVLEGEWPAARW